MEHFLPAGVVVVFAVVAVAQGACNFATERDGFAAAVADG